MRRCLTWTLVLVGMIVIAAAGIATASKPVVVRAGNLILTLSGDVFPVALPENTPAPITLKVSGSVAIKRQKGLARRRSLEGATQP